MYIVRWLLGHSIIATWVALSVVAILLIFGSGDKEEELSSDISIASPSNAVKTVVSSAEEKASIDTAAKEKTIKVIDSGETKKTADLNASVTTKAVIPPLKSELDKVSKPDDSVSTKSTATTDLGQATNEEMLLMAREAYWNNGLDEAAEIYNKLIEKEPKVLEHKGELGNVYWRQGYPKKAAELYSEIAIPMIESGGTERVENMIGFIGLFYPDRAAEIYQKMQSEKSK